MKWRKGVAIATSLSLLRYIAGVRKLPMTASYRPLPPHRPLTFPFACPIVEWRIHTLCRGAEDLSVFTLTEARLEHAKVFSTRSV